MIDITVYQDTGALTGGRGTPVLVDNFDMKDSGDYSIQYYPTKEMTGAPLVRPLNSGEQDISFPVYTFFKIVGDGEVVKNLRFLLTLAVSDSGGNEVGEANNVQLFYKHTNVYQTPTAAVDGDMIYVGTPTGTVLQTEFWPMLSTVGPHMATSRNTTYTLSATPLYTNYFVTQMRVNKGSTAGNSCRFQLRLSVHEFA